MKKATNSIECPICNRFAPPKFTEKHHLVPKSKKGKITVVLCIDCAHQVHKIFTLKELERAYNTIEKIVSDARIKKWIEWINKRPDRFGFCMATKKRRRK